MALRKVTGKTLHQMWEDTYGANLGMGKAPFYLTDGEDVAFALGGLNLRTRDYAKFGQLFLQGGEWGGKQLVSEAWVKDSTINHAPNLHPVRGSGYGYQWWVPMPQEGPSKGDYFAIGIYGQYIYVNPAMNIVIAKNAADREFTVPQSNGQHSMSMNIDIFRSLAQNYQKEHYNSLSLEEQFEFRSKAFFRDKMAGILDGVSNSSGRDLRKEESSNVYRVFSSGSLNHTDMEFTLAINGDAADVKYRENKRFLKPDHSLQVPVKRFEIESDAISSFLNAFNALDICSESLPKSIGLDGTNWVFETSLGGRYCADIYWGGRRPKILEPLILEMENILEMHE